MKRPSSVEGLRRAVSGPVAPEVPEVQADPGPPVPKRPVSPKPPARPARVTLNLPPDLYRQLLRWCDTAAEAMDVPRVGVQDALRGIIREVVSNPHISAKMVSSVHDELR